MTWHDWLYKLLAEARLHKPRPGPTPPYVPDVDKVLKAINRRRSNQGIRPQLTGHRQLTHTAQLWADHLAITGQLAHDNYEPRIRFAFPEANVVGEIIAWGQETAEKVVADWMTSPGHRARILDSSYRYAGVGRAFSKSGVPFWVVTFAG